MARLTPIGTLQFDASSSPDVVGYRAYFTTDASRLEAPNIYDDPSLILVEVEAVEGQTEYTVAIPTASLGPVDGEVFASIVAVDDDGNLSDPTTPVSVRIDTEAPLPPTNVRFVAG